MSTAFEFSSAIWSANHCCGGTAVAAAASRRVRASRSPASMASAAFIAAAVALTSYGLTTSASAPRTSTAPASRESTIAQPRSESTGTCLLYTSDAADEEDSVDLGGRRIIKKKKQ